MDQGRGTPRAAAIALSSLSSLTLLLGSANAADLASCDRSLREQPLAYASWICYYDLARQGATSRTEVAHRLDELSRAGSPPWVDLIQGHLAWGHDDDLATARYEQAIRGFVGRGDLVLGEVLARLALRNLLYRRGLVADAEEQVGRAVAAAEAGSDRVALHHALNLRARHAMESGGDLDRAWIDARRARDLLTPSDDYALRRTSQWTFADLAFRLGRGRDAVAAYRRLVELARAQGDEATYVDGVFNLANARGLELMERTEAGGREELEALATEALRASRAAGMEEIEARASRLLGVITDKTGREDLAEEHLGRCLELARRLGSTEREISCLWAQAEARSERAPGDADALARRAVELAISSGNPRYQAYAWQARMHVAWRTMAPADAWRESRRALDAVERLRAAQREESSSIGLFSAWAREHYWLTGRLLAPPAGEPMVKEAFEVSERLRARRLLEDLATAKQESSASHFPTEHDPHLAERLRQVDADIALVQRALLAAASDATERDRLLLALDRLELEERAIAAERRERERTGAVGVVQHSLISLDAAAGSLAENEALLVFLVDLERDLWGEPAGGSWLLSITGAGTRVFTLPDRLRLEPQIELYLGLIARRDDRERPAAARLYDQLLRAALDELPPAIERLILIADGALYRLPFATLRASADAAPLGATFELSEVPSATLWSAWRRAPQAPLVTAPALVLGDPSLPGQNDGVGARRDAMSYGALPHARREARSIARLLGGGTRVLVGEQASEAVLVAANPGSYAVLHFAAHAIADQAHPQRSGVLLAAGSSEEDGLLQVGEAADLGLEGRTVVLSACSTAVGDVRRGEGVLSLARGFFRAGAHNVIATRWPLRDDEAAVLFSLFYRELARGHSPSAALREMQRVAIAQGLPAAAWASPVLLGDGARSLFPGGELRGFRLSFTSTAALVGSLLVVAAVILVLRRRS